MSAYIEEGERALNEAIAWHHALQADDADWDGYARWLNADPRHRAAYDEVALIDRTIQEHAPALRRSRSSVADVPRRSRLLRLGPPIALAAAAAGVGAIGLNRLRAPTPDAIYASGPSARRITLAAGVAVDLAPSSQLVALAGDPAHLRLSEGEAFLSVRHDPARPLTVEVGRYAVTDVGTRFSVNVGGGWVSVGVEEGRVSVAGPGVAPAELDAGQRLLAPVSGAGGTIAATGPDTVGGWRSGRLTYTDAPLALVAADLARHTGRSVVVDRAVAERSFSGVLAFDDGTRVFRDLGELAGIGFTTQRDGGVRLFDHARRGTGVGTERR